MATVFGKIEELDSSHEDWPQYVERLGYRLRRQRHRKRGKEARCATHTYWSNHVQTPA